MGRADAARRRRQQEEARRRRTAKPTKNVVHAGQRAVLNGKPVIADGRGNWRPVGGRDRTPVGSYTPGNDRTKPKGPREGQKRINNGNNQTYKDGKWVTTSKAGAGARRTAEAKPTAPKPTAPKPTAPKPTAPKPTTRQPDNAGRGNGAPGAQRTPRSNQPRNAGAGNGAPRPAETQPSSPPKTPHIKSDRLRNALKSVKKYKPKN